MPPRDSLSPPICDINVPGTLNILIAGKSGVGKSTLINTLFDANMAKVGQGRPVTEGLFEYSVPGSSVVITDTRGFELAAFEEIMMTHEILLQERRTSTDPNRHIHVVWLCLAEESRRIEEAEQRYAAMVQRYAPLVVLITKARADRGFREVVERAMPGALCIQRIRAIPEELDTGEELPAMGLASLVEMTGEMAPMLQERAQWAAEQHGCELVLVKHTVSTFNPFHLIKEIFRL